MKNLRMTLFAIIVLLLVLAGCKPRNNTPAAPPRPLAAATTPIPTLAPTSTPLPEAGLYIPHYNPGQSLLIFDIQIRTLMDGWAIGRAVNEDSDHILVTANAGYTWQRCHPAAAGGGCICSGRMASSSMPIPPT